MTGKPQKRPTNTIQVRVPDEGELGPAMLALKTERQRAFVIAYLESGGRSQLHAYLAAGYSGTLDDLSARSDAGKLLHDERIQEALREESQKRLGAATVLATSELVKILQDENPAIKPTTKMKAIGMILNRTGLHEKTEHRVSVKKEMTETEKLAAIEKLALMLNVDAKQLLGNAGYNTSELHKPELDSSDGKSSHGLIDAEYVDVTPTTAGLEDLI